jgi:hypothetical protein
MFLAIQILPRHTLEIIFNTSIEKMENIPNVLIGEILSLTTTIPITKKLTNS